MIRISGKEDEKNKLNKITFEPRAGYKKTHPSLEFPLLYGHRCPYCTNVIQALFESPKPIDLWAYEETFLLSQGEKNAGEVRNVYPNDKTKQGKTCYNNHYSPTGKGYVKIVLKNHIMRHRAIVEGSFNGEGLWEPGEKPCGRSGIFSIREDLLMKDFLLFSKMQPVEVAKYKMPKVREAIKSDNVNFRVVPAIGEAPPIILVEKDSFIFGFHYKSRPLVEAKK